MIEKLLITRPGEPSKGDLNQSAFTEMWKEIVKRHDALRTGVFWKGLNQPVQVVFNSADFCPSILDFSNYVEEAQLERLARVVDADRNTQFDLTLPPLIRITLIKRADSAYTLIFSNHHLILDAWCMRVFLNELHDAQTSLLQGIPITYPKLRGNYRSYIRWIKSQDVAVAEDSGSNI